VIRQEIGWWEAEDRARAQEQIIRVTFWKGKLEGPPRNTAR